MEQKAILQKKILNRIELVKLATMQIASARDEDERKHWEKVKQEMENEKYALLAKIQELKA